MLCLYYPTSLFYHLMTSFWASLKLFTGGDAEGQIVAYPGPPGRVKVERTHFFL